MNKLEVIKSIHDMLNKEFYLTGRRSVYIDKIKIVELVNQIDEPQKVVVPKFVAEWITYCKQCTLDLQDLLSRLEDRGELYDWSHDENDGLISERLDTIARAWLDGYTVEKEKLYTVEIPNPNDIRDEHTVLIKNAFNKIVMVKVHGDSWLNVKFYQLTEAEIRKEFEWAWQFAKEV